MLRDAAPVTDLSPTLLDAITDHITGLQKLRLRRGQGRKGYVSINASWTLLGETSGEPTGHDEKPDDEPEDIAREVYSAAVEEFAAGSSKERRFELELRVAVADSTELQVHSVGFELTEDAQPLRTSIEHEQAVVLRTLSSALGDAYRELGRQNRTLNANVRAVGQVFQQAMSMRMEAFEDHFNAAIYGLTGHKVAKSDGDDAWKTKAAETVDTLIGALAAKAGAGEPSEGESAPKTAAEGAEGKGDRALRDALGALGRTITDPQRGQLIGAAGISTMKLLLDAEKAATDEEAARLVHQFLQELGPKHAKVTAILSAEQQDRMNEALALYDAMVEVDKD